jgi:hypothetical protein
MTLIIRRYSRANDLSWKKSTKISGVNKGTQDFFESFKFCITRTDLKVQLGEHTP